MRRRVVTVPKDKKAEEALDYDKARQEQLIELSLEEADFYFLHQSGIIELINKIGDANIDDFEDDVVCGKENLNKIIAAIQLNEPPENDSNYQLVNNLLTLFKEAINRNTGVYFYF